MTLARDDIDQIRELIREELASRIPPEGAVVHYDIELRERILRVEEELRHQRELMEQGFKLMEKRFEQIDKRFEQVEKRFEQIDKRFEMVDKRFESLAVRLDAFMRWSFATTLTVGGLVVAAIKLLP